VSMLTEILRQDSQARIFHQLAVVALLVRVLSSACQATGKTLVICGFTEVLLHLRHMSASRAGGATAVLLAT
jgi:hypothetical protein